MCKFKKKYFKKVITVFLSYNVCLKNKEDFQACESRLFSLWSDESVRF